MIVRRVLKMGRFRINEIPKRGQGGDIRGRGCR